MGRFAILTLSSGSRFYARRTPNKLKPVAQLTDDCGVAGVVVSPEIALFRALHEIAVAVGGVLDPVELACIVVERAYALLDADAAGVYVWDPEKNAAAVV
jgi:hypothetical protein